MSSSLVPALCLLLTLLWAGALAQEWTSCASLQRYVNERPGCDVDEACSSVYCYGDTDATNKYFYVRKCEDAVTVDVHVNFLDGLLNRYEFYYSYNKSETVVHEYAQESFNGTLERNATHLGFMLTRQHIGGSVIYSVFDPVYIPLDPGDCMCSTMQEVAYIVNCNAECTSMRCDYLTQPFSMNMHVTPCDVPPSLQFNIFANGRTQIIFTDGNQTTTLTDVGGMLNITMWHFDYSMDVELTWVNGTTTQFILNMHKIILNLTECGPPHPITITATGCGPHTGSPCPTSDIPTAVTSSIDDYDGPSSDDLPSPNTPSSGTSSSGTSPTTSEPSTCTAMKSIAAQIKKSGFLDEDATCELNECSDLNCTSDDTDLRIVLHCSSMAVGIQYTDKESSYSESKIFKKSGTLANGLIEVTVENRGGNVLGFALEIPTFEETVISYTQISLNSCSSGSKESSTGVSKAVVATAVTVPLVVLLLIAAVIVIVAGVYWARLHRKQHQEFLCTIMSQVDRDEDC